MDVPSPVLGSAFHWNPKGVGIARECGDSWLQTRFTNTILVSCGDGVSAQAFSTQISCADGRRLFRESIVSAQYFGILHGWDKL